MEQITIKDDRKERLIEVWYTHIPAIFKGDYMQPPDTDDTYIEHIYLIESVNPGRDIKKLISHKYIWDYINENIANLK